MSADSSYLHNAPHLAIRNQTDDCGLCRESETQFPRLRISSNERTSNWILFSTVLRWITAETFAHDIPGCGIIECRGSPMRLRPPASIELRRSIGGNRK